jgi:signal recognition particle subunit SRP72
MIPSQRSEEHSDILTNLQASQSHLDFINTDFLHSLDALPSSTTSNLESRPPPTQPLKSLLSPTTTAEQPTATPEPIPAEKDKKKKPRASRIPKGVVPGVTPPPDPERWLKKSERSGVGVGSKKRKGGGGGGATQGTAAMGAGSEGVSAPVSAGNVKSGKGKKKR